MTEEEVWKDIIGYDGRYSVSNFGRVRSNARKYTRLVYGKYVTQNISEMFLKCGANSSGYPTIALCKDGKCTPRYVHELVMLHFIGERPKGYHICHSDGNPLNNKVVNLRYDTPKGNSDDRHKHGTNSVGIKNPMSKYTEELIVYIKNEVKTRSQKAVADELGIPPSTVRSIKQGRIWKHL